MLLFSVCVILVVAIVFLVTLIFTLAQTKSELNVALEKLEATREEREKFRTLGQEYLAENKALSKYKGVLDIEQKANQMIRLARSEVEQIKRDSEQIIQDAHLEAETITQNARTEYDNLLTKISDAQRKFRYSKSLPEHHEKLKSRFEDLKSKHEELKAALKTAKSGVKDEALIEKEREILASKFDKLGLSYIDDTFKFVASKMTTSNFTASRDRVLKAVSLCRSLGFDWRENLEDKYENKVREEYKRVLRLEEMRLEQQRIKDQIREEQRAARELEALKKKEEQFIKEQEESERQRETMQKMIADALARANGEHTAQILEMEKALADKDKEIEAKQQEIEDNQRSISNAQLTKAGHIYVISNIGSFGENVFKIGMTRRTVPEERVKELGDASVPFPFDVHLMVSSDNAPELEKHLHHTFRNYQVNRVNPRKEFFKLDVDEVRSAIKSFLGKDVDYIADPHVLEEYAEQYRQSQNTSLEDIEEIESMMEEVGITDEVE